MGQTARLDRARDLGRELGLALHLAGVGVAQVGVDIRAAYTRYFVRSSNCQSQPFANPFRLAALKPSGATIPSVIDWSTCPAVERDPGRVSGARVFRGTRVPVSALFENLEDDASVHQFIEWFPGVMLEQARAVLEHAARSSLAAA